jgi:4-hydroxy-2-oxoheptanedioate aldolase
MTTHGEDRIRSRWDNGEPALAFWTTGASLGAVEALGRLDFDAIVVDMQHAPLGTADVLASLIALDGGGATPLVRLLGHEPAVIGQALDAGAAGVICPVVETRAEAEALVRAAHYPPVGVRSWGPLRVLRETGTEYVERSRNSVLTIAMIESVQAVADVEKIATVPGLDMLLMGPSDLSLSGGGPPIIDCSSSEAVERHRRVADAARSAGIHAGMITRDAESAAAGVEWGMDFISLGAAQAMLLAGAANILAAGREAVAGSDR